MEVIKNIVYKDKITYDAETKDPSTLYIVNDSKLQIYFRGMKLYNVIYQDSLPENLSQNCFYVIDDCLYYSGDDGKTIFKLFDSSVTGILKVDDSVRFLYKDGSYSDAIAVDQNCNMYPESVRSQVVDKVGEIDLTINWNEWGG